MLASTFSAFFAIAVSTISAQTYNVCQVTPFRGLSCLNGNAAAAGVCSTAVVNETTTITSTTSVLSVITSAASAPQITDQVTVNITSFETSTVTITAGEPSTTYSPVIATTCISSTITTYVPATPTAKRAKRQSAASACASSGLAYLDIISNTTAANTACSCIGYAAPTSTVTKYVTSVVSSTAVSYAGGNAPTTTAYFIDRLTCTETKTPAPVVIPVSTTTTLTEISTVSLAAPTFRLIYGPKAGCADLGVGKAHILDASVTDKQQAIAMCKDVCEQEPTCRFLYVQRMFTDYGGASPYFECYMNDHEFNELTDLQCGQKPGIYATARGYDACGRGGPQATIAPEP